MRAKRWVVLYESGPDIVRRTEPYMAEHVANFERLAASGELISIGTFADPQADGAMTVLVSLDAARRFVEGDPFVREGLVRYRVLEWTDLYAREPSGPGDA